MSAAVRHCYAFRRYAAIRFHIDIAAFDDGRRLRRFDVAIDAAIIAGYAACR